MKVALVFIWPLLALAACKQPEDPRPVTNPALSAPAAAVESMSWDHGARAADEKIRFNHTLTV